MDPVRWEEGRPVIVDQSALPAALKHRRLESVQELCSAIQGLEVRGAPAIGIAGAYGVALAALEAREIPEKGSHGAGAEPTYRERILELSRGITAARPTAVNLEWAVKKVLAELERQPESAWPEAALAAAKRIHREDRDTCRSVSRIGARFIRDGGVYLTHCNAGPLATSGVGTALGVFIEARREGRSFEVLVGETRPLLQGARLTAWELMEADIPCRLICDSAAAYSMARLGVAGVFVGADRIATNGDTANKVGSYGLALAARYHGIPYYVAAPASTVDPGCPDGSRIPIEERAAGEVRGYGRRCWAPEQVRVWNPAFDVIPAELITRIITERGAHEAPFRFTGHVD